MEDINKDNEKPGVGIVGKIIAVLGGIGAGTAAFVGTVSHSVRKNIRGALDPIFKNMDAVRDRLKNHIAADPTIDAFNGNKRQVINETHKMANEAQFSHFNTDLHNNLEGVADHPIIKDIDRFESRADNGTVLGMAKKEAGKEFKATRAKSVLGLRKDVASIAETLEKTTDATARNALKGQLVDAAFATVKKTEETHIANIVKKVPFTKKLFLSSELHLTNGQKGLAALAFAGAAAVTAGAVYYGVKMFSPSQAKDATPSVQ